MAASPSRRVSTGERLNTAETTGKLQQLLAQRGRRHNAPRHQHGLQGALRAGRLRLLAGNNGAPLLNQTLWSVATIFPIIALSAPTLFWEITIQFLSFADVTFQDGALIRAVLLDGFLAPIDLYPNRKAIRVLADKP
jgi:hypothetical protein